MTLFTLDKSQAIQWVRSDGLILAKMGAQLQDDEDVVRAAIADSGAALAHASERLKGMKAIVLQAIANWGPFLSSSSHTPFESANEALRDDPDVVEAAFQKDPDSLKFASKNRVLERVQQDGTNLRFASNEHRNDPEIVKAAVEKHSLAVLYASTNCIMQLLQQDVSIPWYCFSQKQLAHRDILLALVKKDPTVLAQEEAANFCTKKAFALEAVNINGDALHHLPAFKDDLEVVNAAYRNKPNSLMYAFRNASLELVRGDGLALEHVSDSFRNDPEFNEAAFQNNPYALGFASRSFRLEKIRQHGSLLRYLSVEHQNTPEIVTAAFQNDPSSLQFASSRCVRDKLAENGLNLQHASQEHRNNYILVSIAVTENGLSLEYASEALRANQDIVRMALNENGLALEYASEALRANQDIVRIALNQNRDALHFASVELQNNPPLLDPEVSSEAEEVSFAVDLERLNQDPVSVLREFYFAMERSFPKITYIGSPGVDQGGISRDFVTRLMKGVFDLDEKRLPWEEADGKIIPLIEEDKPDQIGAYYAIGALFSYALRRNPAMTTGNYFHPLFFQMIHSLTTEEIEPLQKLEHYSDLPQKTIDKLFTIYARESLHFSEPQINSILQGVIPLELQQAGYTTQEDFFHSYFKKMALAAVVVFDSLCAHLQDPREWEALKGTASELAAKIEGSLTREQVLASLVWNREHEPTKAYLTQWLNECSFKDLERFVLAITGSPTLIPGNNLRIYLYRHSHNLPSYHTCFTLMDLPDGYPTYDAFKQKLELSLSSVHGIQVE